MCRHRIYPYMAMVGTLALSACAADYLADVPPDEPLHAADDDPATVPAPHRDGGTPPGPQGDTATPSDAAPDATGVMDTSTADANVDDPAVAEDALPGDDLGVGADTPPADVPPSEPDAPPSEPDIFGQDPPGFEPDPERDYKLTCQYLGPARSLDTYVDVNLLFMGLTGARAGQRWRFIPIGAGRFRISNRSRGSGSALAVAGDGQTLLIVPAGLDHAQAWRLVAFEDGVRLVNHQLGPDRSLDIDLATDRPTMSATGRHSGQLWTITPVQ